MKTPHRLIALLLSAALLAGLAACQSQREAATGYAVSAAQVARAGAELHLTYDAISAVVGGRLDTYTAEEQQRLRSVHQALLDLRTAVERFDASGTGAAVLSVDDVSHLYQRARTAYADARAIIAPRLPAMLPSERAALERWDTQAHALDAAVLSLLKTPDGRDISHVIGDVITLAAGGVRMAVSAGLI